MRRTLMHLVYALALFGGACGHAIAPSLATSIDCAEAPDPGVCSPLRHPV